MTVNDAKYAFFQGIGWTGHLDDMELSFLRDALGVNTGTVNDLWRDYWALFGHDGTVNDVAYAGMGDLGHTGSISDRWLQFWQSPAPVPPPLT